MYRENKDEKAKKYGKVSDKPDSYLAGPEPTAHSEEFVPKPINSITAPPQNGSDEIFDFIPEIKSEKYKK